jgi:hypothetical protein
LLSSATATAATESFVRPTPRRVNSSIQHRQNVGTNR